MTTRIAAMFSVVLGFGMAVPTGLVIAASLDATTSLTNSTPTKKIPLEGGTQNVTTNV